MKFAHLADLHIGKRINNFSMLEDQKYILTQVVNILQKEKPEAVFIAGDIYDTPLPPVEAVRLLDKFLTELAELKMKVFIISGNHDSAERLSFGTGLLNKSGVYISPVFTGIFSPIKIQDEYGSVNIYMLPFLKPVYAKKAWPEEDIRTYDDAVRTAVEKMRIDREARNIIIAHQFVTGAQTSDSEEISIGGLDNISAEIFYPFDYAALGHIHRPQQIGRAFVRYAGTPLKYSFSECGHKKTLAIVNIKEKGKVDISARNLQPLHDMRRIRGNYADLVLRENYEGTDTEDYLAVTLTDENEIPDAIGKLRTIYPNIMKIDYDNKRTQTNNIITANTEKSKLPIDMLSEFYALQNNKPFSKKQRNFAEKLIEQIWEEH
ncbi:exonuclease SbcCD subunit D [Pectinatus haikarae]|uniref:exonuclease SbcCD subunit D n=1 Tax=Pectinatus haikarae TaxID=349096 RepID=UPI0018C6EBD2|nr:exonuclease SbcCD subunit D [Pectinatus haikarae]